MTDNPNVSPDFKVWEYEHRRERVERDFAAAYELDKEWALNADVIASRATNEVVRHVVSADMESLMRVKGTLKKVAFMFSTPEDCLDVNDLAARVFERYIRNTGVLVGTADAMERYATYMPPYFTLTINTTGKDWQTYSATQAFHTVETAMLTFAESDYGETDI